MGIRGNVWEHGPYGDPRRVEICEAWQQRMACEMEPADFADFCEFMGGSRCGGGGARLYVDMENAAIWMS